MIKVGIVGVSGFSGREALKILLKHRNVRVTYVSANNSEGPIGQMWPELSGRTPLVCEKFHLKKASTVDVIFLAVPHTTAMTLAPQFLQRGIKVIDLSGDYRLKNARLYKKWYKETHTDKSNLRKSVYGLPELYRSDIQKAHLIANPGCYPTAAILGLAPAMAIYGNKIDSITIDAKSGVSGAGRKASIALSHASVHDNFKAYKALYHQHMPEIDLYLSKISNQNIQVDFVPHLLPINRGILETIYIRFNTPINVNEMQKIYQKFYKIEPFVRVKKPGLSSELHHVQYTNFCDLALHQGANSKLLVITSAIDNLIKGAAGQAIQNMNIMCNFNETEGLL